jgi:hypothetical protein
MGVMIVMIVKTKKDMSHIVNIKEKYVSYIWMI